MKRLVLVDRTSNRVCGDTSALEPHARNWASIVDQFDDDTAGLAACAARFLDQSLGKTARDYIFTPFAADRDSDGYLMLSQREMLPPTASIHRCKSSVSVISSGFVSSISLLKFSCRGKVASVSAVGGVKPQFYEPYEA